jgi:hypothetical protein
MNEILFAKGSGDMLLISFSITLPLIDLMG